MRDPSPLAIRLAPALTSLLFLGPLAAGVYWTVLPAFGYLPALGEERFGLEPLRAALTAPETAKAAAVTLTSALGSTALALLFAFAILGRVLRGEGRIARGVGLVVLAAPHAAIAIGFAFLAAPSGWIARLFSPWLTGFDAPPDIATIGDPWGVALLLGLALKEAPFLVAVAIAAAARVDGERRLLAARSLGHGAAFAFWSALAPAIYVRIRLPIFATLAFAAGVVDMALILGPSLPPTLAVLTADWFADADLARRAQASAASLLQCVLAVLAVALWMAGERLAGFLLRRAVFAGVGARASDLGARALTLIGQIGAALAALAGAGSLLALTVWAFAGRWRFPDALPADFAARAFRRDGDHLLKAAATSVMIALGVTAIALVASILCLEREAQRGAPAGAATTALLYAPLLAPQAAFVFGLQTGMIGIGLDGSALAVGCAHLVYVLPYVFLALAGPYRALDPRWAQQARALGAGPWRTLFLVKLPMSAQPLAFAAALGLAVSFALYLPTLAVGGGRVETLATQAVTAASGGDRRLAAASALCLAAGPLLAFALAASVGRAKRGGR